MGPTLLGLPKALSLMARCPWRRQSHRSRNPRTKQMLDILIKLTKCIRQLRRYSTYDLEVPIDSGGSLIAGGTYISCRRAPRRLCKEKSSCGPFATPQSTVVQSKSQSSLLSTLDWRGSLTAAVDPPRMECCRDSNALPDGKSSTWE